MIFVKYDNFWYKYDANTPLSCATFESIISFGKMTNVDITNLEIVEATDASNLDWYGTKVYDNNYLTGWLAPDGKFYGCDYRYHKEQAKVLHKLSEQQIEEKGFVKITYVDRLCQNLVAMLHWHYSKQIPITNSQYNFLKHYPIKNLQDVDYLYRENRKQSQNSYTSEITNITDELIK